MIVRDHFTILRSGFSGQTLTTNHYPLLTTSGSAIEIGSLMSSGSLKVIGNVTITGLATFLGDVHIEGDLVLSNRQTGFATIPASGSAVTVTFSGAMTMMPIVNVSPDTPIMFAVMHVSATGFTIRVEASSINPITFAYVALSADQPETTLGHAAASESTPTLIPFTVNSLGQPVSSDAVWNGCIQGKPLLDSEGIPFSCSRYHSSTTWDHPDLHISFIYNANHDPAILTIPEGYQVVVLDDEGSSTPIEATPEPEPLEEEEVVSEPSTDSGSKITPSLTEDPSNALASSSGSSIVEGATPEPVESSAEPEQPAPAPATEAVASTENLTQTGSTVQENKIENFILDLLNSDNPGSDEQLQEE